MKFRLESILSLKNNIEQMKQKELADAFLAKQKLVDKKNELTVIQKNINLQIRRSLIGTIAPNTLLNFTNYQAKLEKDINHVDSQITKASLVVKQKQEELVEAMKERKILENLKNMHIEAVRTHMLAEEQKLADEIVGYKYIERERSEDDG